MECGAIPPPAPVGKLKLYWISCSHVHATPAKNCRPKIPLMSHRLPYSAFTSYYFFNPSSHTRTLQVSGRTPLELWGISQGSCDTRRIRATQGIPKRKSFNRSAVPCTSTRTHLEGRRSVELRNLPFKPCPRAPRAGVLVAV